MIYNQGTASAIIERMDAVRPFQLRPAPAENRFARDERGVQAALGAAPYLDQWLDAKITEVSIGGVFVGTSGFGVSEHVYHLRGQRDWVDDLGVIVFLSGRPWAVSSPLIKPVSRVATPQE